MSARVLAILSLVLLFASSSFAAPTPEDQKRAAESFRQAEAAFARKEYAAAAAAFELAARFAPHPTAHLNAAEAWELAGDPVRAAEACERAIALADPDPSFQAEAKKRLEALGPKVARIEIAGPPRMRVRIDGGEEIAPPAKRYVTPGTHRIEVRDPEGGTSSTSTVAPAGETAIVDLTPARVEPPPPPQPDHRPPPPPVIEDEPPVPAATWVAFGIAGAAGTAVAILGGLTVAAQSTFEEDPTQPNADAFYAMRVGTNVSIGIAGAAALTGAIIWIVDATSGPSTVAVAPWLSDEAGGLSVGGRF
jgi:hypothetical protein